MLCIVGNIIVEQGAKGRRRGAKGGGKTWGGFYRSERDAERRCVGNDVFPIVMNCR